MKDDIQHPVDVRPFIEIKHTLGAYCPACRQPNYEARKWARVRALVADIWAEMDKRHATCTHKRTALVRVTQSVDVDGVAIEQDDFRQCLDCPVRLEVAS